jgi:hypothetical protein
MPPLSPLTPRSGPLPPPPPNSTNSLFPTFSRSKIVLVHAFLLKGRLVRIPDESDPLLAKSHASFKLLSSPGILNESISPAYLARRAGTITLFILGS